MWDYLMNKRVRHGEGPTSVLEVMALITYYVTIDYRTPRFFSCFEGFLYEPFKKPCQLD